MRSINEAIITQLENEELRQFNLAKLTIDGTDYAYTDCDIPIVTGGVRYEPHGFTFDQITYSMTKVVDQARMRIDNLDDVLTPVFVGGTPQGSAVVLSQAVLDSNYDVISPGTNVEKTSGTAAWDASVYSTSPLVAGCEVSFEPQTTDVRFMIGINTDPTTDNNYTSIDYCIYCRSDGDLGIYESGVNKGIFSTYVVGDLFSVKYDGATTVKYYKNEVLIYTSLTPTASGETFYLDSSFNEVGGAANDLKFYAYTVTPTNAVLTNSTPDTMTITGPAVLFQGEIGAWDLDEGEINCTITNQFSQWTQKTLNIHSANCRWKVFKGTECAYAGAETWCDRSYSRCTALSNTANFGGFRWLTSIMDKDIWWGQVPK